MYNWHSYQFFISPLPTFALRPPTSTLRQHVSVEQTFLFQAQNVLAYPKIFLSKRPLLPFSFSKRTLLWLLSFLSYLRDLLFVCSVVFYSVSNVGVRINFSCTCLPHKKATFDVITAGLAIFRHQTIRHPCINLKVKLIPVWQVLK